MADKKVNNIVLPTGETIALPSWASETTMQQVAAYMSATNKYDQKFVKLVDSLGGDLGSLQKTVSDLTTSVKVDNKQDQKQQAASKKLSSELVGAAKTVSKASSFFGKAEAPLSGMKDAASSVWSSLKGTASGSKWAGNLISQYGDRAKLLGMSIDVAADAALAYAGWNAAKYEQFAQAQASAVNFGILLNDGAESYDILRKNAIAGGITYTKLLDITGKYGDAMLGLGDTMGTGSQQFADMFQKLNTAADSYGDLGMQSSEMAEAYAEYLSYARRTGQINRNMNRSAEDVNSSFINLQLESNAIASLTALSASEARRRQTQAFSVQGSAAVFSLRESGLPGQATVADAMIRNLGTIAPESAEMQQLLDVYQDSLMMYKNDMSRFDINAALGGEMVTAVSHVLGPEFINTLESMTRTGTASAEEVRTFLFGALNNANTDARYSSTTTAGSVGSTVRSLQASVIELERKFGNLGDPGAVEAAISNVTNNIDAAGSVTENLNNMTRTFLELQETITIDMSTVADIFDGLRNAMQGSRSLFEDLLNAVRGESVNDFGGINGNGTVGSDIEGGLKVVYDSTGAGRLVDSVTGLSPVHTPGPSTSGSGNQVDNNVASTVNSDGQRGGGVTQAQIADNITNPDKARGEGIDQTLQAILAQAGRETGVDVVIGSGANEMTLDEIRSIQAREPNRVRQQGTKYWLDGQAVRTGSNRHDHGQSADLTLTRNGRTLSMANADDMKIIEEYTRRARELGITGIGAGQRLSNGDYDYMGDKTLHLGFGSDTYWGAEGSGSNAPAWLRNLYSTTPASSRASEVQTTPASTTTPHDHTNTEVSPNADFFSGVDKGLQETLVSRLGNESESDANSAIARIRTGEIFADSVDNNGNITGTGTMSNLLKDLVDSDTVDLQSSQTKQLLNSFADSILAQHLAMQQATPRRFGGNVFANLPYLVGDQLGLNTAELFVPETAGRIVNNTELNKIIGSALTDTQQNANIANIDLSSLISNKEETLRAAEELRNALKTLLRSAKRHMEEDITNSR